MNVIFFIIAYNDRTTKVRPLLYNFLFVLYYHEYNNIKKKIRIIFRWSLMYNNYCYFDVLSRVLLTALIIF